MDIDRRALLKYAGALGTGMLVSGLPKMAAAKKVEEVKVGVMEAFSGFLGKTGDWNKKATNIECFRKAVPEITSANINYKRRERKWPKRKKKEWASTVAPY